MSSVMGLTHNLLVDTLAMVRAVLVLPEADKLAIEMANLPHS